MSLMWTDGRTREDNATEALDAVRLRFAIMTEYIANKEGKGLHSGSTCTGEDVADGCRYPGINKEDKIGDETKVEKTRPLLCLWVESGAPNCRHKGQKVCTAGQPTHPHACLPAHQKLILYILYDVAYDRF